VVAVGGVAIAAKSKKDSDSGPLLGQGAFLQGPVVKAEPNWMNDNWVGNTLMTQSGVVPLPGYAAGSTQYKVRPTSWGTVDGVLMIALETPEMLEPAAQTLRNIMGPDGLAKRKVLLKSGNKTVNVVW